MNDHDEALEFRAKIMDLTRRINTHVEKRRKHEALAAKEKKLEREARDERERLLVGESVPLPLFDARAALATAADRVEAAPPDSYGQALEGSRAENAPEATASAELSQPAGTLDHPAGAMESIGLGNDVKSAGAWSFGKVEARSTYDEGMTVRCPECSADAGAPCVKPEGRGRMPNFVHMRRVAVARQSKPPAKKLPKQRKRREHVDAKAKPKPSGVGVTMRDGHGLWKRCLACDGDMAAITGIGRRDKGECHRPRYEVAALGGCNVDGWRESPLWELDLSGPMQKRIPDSIENIGMFNDWLADESMGQSLPRDFFDALALFKHRLQNLHDKAKDSRKRRATAKREALARPTSGLTSAAMAKAVAP